MNYKKPNLKALQAECDAFNAQCPIGGNVRVKIDGSEEPRYTTTRTEAQIMCGHSSVIWMDGISGSYLLSCVTPVSAEEAKQHAELKQSLAGETVTTPAIGQAPLVETGGDLPNGWRNVPVLPTVDQLRAAMKFTNDAELAKSIYLAMTSPAALVPSSRRRI